MPDGDFIDLETHGNHADWLGRYITMNKLQDKISKWSSPPGWIKVATASQIFFAGKSWDGVTKEQIDGLIEMWGSCSKHSRWIQRETETFKCIFGLIEDSTGRTVDEHMTIPEFLGLYGGRKSIDNFYGMLLGEL